MNRLSMAKISSIKTLHCSGHSNREIARLLGVDRGTVNAYVRRLTAVTAQNRPPAANPHTGSGEGDGKEKPAVGPCGPDGETAKTRPPAANPHTGSAAENTLPAERLEAAEDASGGESGPRSLCEQYREQIQQQLDMGLSIKRIHQDLVTDYGFTGSYYSVRRFAKRLDAKSPEPFRRMETEPGEEAQIDFGTAAWVNGEDGKKRRPWMLRVVLSCSRKAYSEVVYHQTTDNFIAAIENAFHYFGGAPKRLVIDNLKAAVKRADWHDPELHPKLQSFAAHYGTVFVPTKPYTPQHKGKVESGVKYAKNNALKGRTFNSLAEQNDYLLHWEETVADTRIHGTTRKQVRQQFEEVERPALLPLPGERFAMFQEGRRTVNRDGHLEVDKAYYSAPPEYISRRVWVRWDTHVVRVFNDRWEQIALHSKCEPGRFRTDGNHIPDTKVSAVERGTDALLKQVAAVGPQTKAWSELVIASRGVEGVRVLVGLKSLAGKHTSAALEQACGRQQFDFIEEHPVIRPLSDYSLESLNAFRKEKETQ